MCMCGWYVYVWECVCGGYVWVWCVRVCLSGTCVVGMCVYGGYMFKCVCGEYVWMYVYVCGGYVYVCMCGEYVWMHVCVCGALNLITSACWSVYPIPCFAVTRQQKYREELFLLFCPLLLPLAHDWSNLQFSSVAQSCPTLCDPMNHSMSGLHDHHQLPEFTQTHAHRVGDAIQPSHPLSSSSLPAPSPSQHQGLFQWVSSSHEVAKVLEFQLQLQSFQWTPRNGLL